MQELISSLFDKHYGKPILVIGGGPSVNGDLADLPLDYFSAVISANDHGMRQHKFKVDYMVNVDKTHLERRMPMREFMRPFKTPIINRLSWSDYRLPYWKLVTNSGLTAVAVASVLGGHPVVTTGIDMWVGGNLYFHRVNPKHRDTPTAIGIRTKMKELQQWCGPAVLRSLQGPVAESHGRFDINEALPDVVPHQYRSAIGPTIHGQARVPFMMDTGDPVPGGAKLAFTEQEWKRAERRYPVDHIGP